jgi:CDGSH-type Zn-finger protein
VFGHQHVLAIPTLLVPNRVRQDRGRFTFTTLTSGYRSTMTPSDSDPRRTTRATVYPEGPILLRGDFEIVEADGTPIPTRRRVVALCRCGHSALAPLCDGTHKAVWPPGGRPVGRARRRAAESDDGPEPA